MLKKTLTVIAIIVGLSTVAACTPEEVEVFLSLSPEVQAVVLNALQNPPHNPPGGYLACVRHAESRGDYQAQNSRSTASGAYQFLDSTWATVSVQAGHGGYAKARHAPPQVQDAVAEYTLKTQGKQPWAANSCR